MRAPGAELGWLGVVRLGLAQTALGAIVVLATNVFNRVMIVEWALPALLPGALIAWHYASQISRPRWGHSPTSAVAARFGSSAASACWESG